MYFVSRILARKIFFSLNSISKISEMMDITTYYELLTEILNELTCC